jgi:hypothetical protein
LPARNKNGVDVTGNDQECSWFELSGQLHLPSCHWLEWWNPNSANPSVMQIINHSSTSHTLSTKVLDLRNNRTWVFTGVYGPQGILEKRMFIRELKQLSQSASPQWLILGNFNLLYQESDKYSGPIDRNMIHRFRRALNHMEVKEIQLSGKKFTWSNRHSNPTMSRIDHAFASVRWERWYPKPLLQTLSSSTSDHCPLMISPLCPPYVRPRFRFESFWTAMPGFQEVVAEAWHRGIPTTINPLTSLHIKLSRTSKALKTWSKTLLPQSKIAMAVCREVIHQLEIAQESRSLSPREHQLINFLKNRLLGLAAIEKCRARQKSRITWVKKGDANTRYFQIMANIRKQRNFIHYLQMDNGIAVTQSEKQHTIFDHYLKHIGTYVPRACSLNFSELNWQPRDLQHLNLPFSEQEIKNAIYNTPKEKAPGLDGYIGSFFT